MPTGSQGRCANAVATRMAHLKYLSITSFLVAIPNLKNDGSTWGDVTADTVNLPNGEKMSLYLSIMALRMALRKK